MANTRDQETHPSQPLIYQIRLKGHLGPHSADWFEGLTIRLTDNGETLLTGPLLDQAALFGVLRKVRDLGIPLLSVMHVQPDPVEVSDVNEAHRYRLQKEGNNESN